MGAACVHDDECASGFCAYGECLEKTATAECTHACSLRGHACSQIHQSGGFGCADWECMPLFRAVPTSAVRKLELHEPWSPDVHTFWTRTVVSCLWAPTKGNHQACVSGLECRSGICVDVTSKTYSVKSSPLHLGHGKYALASWLPSYSPSRHFGPLTVCKPDDTASCAVAPGVLPAETHKLCASPSPAICDANGLKARLVRATRWDDADVPGYVCEGCSDTIYEAKPLWKEAFALLSPAACERIYKSYHALQTPWSWGQSFVDSYTWTPVELGVTTKELLRGIKVGEQWYLSSYTSLPGPNRPESERCFVTDGK